MTLRSLKQALKTSLSTPKSQEAFERAKLRLPTLAHHHTPFSVLAVLGDESSRRYPEKEELTRTLMAEYQRCRETLWSSMLLVAYYPVLKKLHRGLRSSVLCAGELEQLVIEQFLQVVADFPLHKSKDRTCMRLRQGTRRAVFQTVKEVDAEHGYVESADDDDLACLECRFIESLDDDDVPGLQTAPWPEPKRKGKPDTDPDELEMMVTLLLTRARGVVPRRKLEVVIATYVHGEKLRSYVSRRHPRATDTERHRMYERLKRERTRTLDVLRGLLADLVVPD